MPLTLNQFREDYPEYDDIPDAKLADGLHKKYYPDMDFETFAGKIDYQFKFEAEETETVSGVPIQEKAGILEGFQPVADPEIMTEAGPLPNIQLPGQPPVQPEELPKTSGLIKDIIKSGIRKGFVDSKIEGVKEAAEERKKEGEKEKKKVVEIKRDPSILDIPTPTTGVEGPEDQQPLPDKAVSTTEKILAYAPYSITRAMRGLLDPFLPALKALGMDTGKALDTAVEYWGEKAGDIGLPDIGIGRSPEGDLEVQKREASLKEIIGQTAELSGFVAGPVKVASKLAGAVVSKIAQSARPFFKSVLKGMVTGGLLGKGEKEQTLQHMALFGVFEGAGYGIGKASEIVKQIKQTRAWVKSGSKDRGLMLQSLEDTLSKNPGMSEGEILKRWKNPQWKAEALAKRVKEPEKPLTEDVKVEKPVVEKPIVEKPIEEPVAKEPVAKEPVVEKPKVPEKPVGKVVVKPVEPKPAEPIKPKVPKKEIYTDIAVQSSDGTIAIGDYAKEGHAAATNELIDKGKTGPFTEGVMTSEGEFVPRPVDKEGVEIDGAELIGKEVPEAPKVPEALKLPEPPTQPAPKAIENLKDFDINVEAEVAETGKKITVKENAKKVYDSETKYLETLRKMLDCLES